MREFWMRLMSVVVIVGLILGYNSVLEARAKDEEIAKLNAKIEKTESLEDGDSKNGSYKDGTYTAGSVGIKTGVDDSVTIKGGGSLNIIHDSRCALSPYTNYFTGIEIGGRAGDKLDSSALTIESCNINISADTEGSFYGISREAYNEPYKKDFEISGSKISIEASSQNSKYGHVVAGIDTQGGNFTIKNSQIDVDLDSDNENAGIFPLATGYEVSVGERIYDGGKLTIEKSDVYMYTSGAASTKGAYAYNVVVDDSAHYYAGKHGLSKEISAKDAWSFNRYWDNRYRARYNCLAITQNALDPTELSMDFEDVSEGAWYYDNVEYVFKHELMSGLNDTTFGPNDPLARAQFATIMYRKEGKPEVSYTNRFKDVSDGNWYTGAIMWASDAGVVTGYSNGNFGPGDKINRIYDRDGDIGIDVADNGPGMTQETIDHIMHNKVISSKRGSGIGVRNVNERIQLIYGEDYGVTITSELDEGTTATITIPKMEETDDAR